MADVELALRIKQIGVGALAAERAGGKRRHEVLSGAGENAAHLRAAVLQAADEIERFVGGNPAADDEKDALALRRSRRRLLRARPGGGSASVKISRPASSAASRRMTRTSSSMERPCRAARRRSRVFSFSSSCRTVRLAIE